MKNKLLTIVGSFVDKLEAFKKRGYKMKYCIRCGGTGVQVNNRYCTCKEGKLKRTLDAGAKKAEEAMKEAAKTTKTTEQVASEKMPKAKPEHGHKPAHRLAIDYKPGEWVRVLEHGNRNTRVLVGATCEVVKVDPGHDEVRIKGYGKSKSGFLFKGEVWLKAKWLEPAPVELDDKRAAALRDMFINLALDTNDKEWLKELGGVRR